MRGARTRIFTVLKPVERRATAPRRGATDVPTMRDHTHYPLAALKADQKGEFHGSGATSVAQGPGRIGPRTRRPDLFHLAIFFLLLSTDCSSICSLAAVAAVCSANVFFSVSLPRGAAPEFVEGGFSAPVSRGGEFSMEVSGFGWKEEFFYFAAERGRFQLAVLEGSFFGEGNAGGWLGAAHPRRACPRATAASSRATGCLSS